MAQTNALKFTPRDAVVTKVTLSSLTKGSTNDITHGGPAQVPDYVTFEVTTAPSDNSAITMVRTKSSDSTTNCRLTFHAAADAGATASLTGAVIDVFFHFMGVKAGGIG